MGAHLLKRSNNTMAKEALVAKDLARLLAIPPVAVYSSRRVVLSKGRLHFYVVA